MFRIGEEGVSFGGQHCWEAGNRGSPGLVARWRWIASEDRHPIVPVWPPPYPVADWVGPLSQFKALYF